MAWTNITNNESGLSVRTKLNTLGAQAGNLRTDVGSSLSTSFGRLALENENTAAPGLNNAAGYAALNQITTGGGNNAQGFAALFAITVGNFNIGVGSEAGRFLADGVSPNQTSTLGLFIGANTKALNDGDVNETVIGFGATGAGSNTVTLGNTNVAGTFLKGKINLGTSYRTTNYTVATLPGTPSAGDHAFVTDALAPVFGTNVAGGGTVNVPVYYDGTNWKVG